MQTTLREKTCGCEHASHSHLKQFVNFQLDMKKKGGNMYHTQIIYSPLKQHVKLQVDMKWV